MSVFLETVTVEEAIRQVLSIAPSPKAGSVSLGNAIGRVVSEDILADIDIPGFTRSVVDGYAVRHSDTSGASESVPAMLEYGGRIGMGEHAGPTENPAGRCMYVPTGGHVPDEFDAVAMIEGKVLRVGSHYLGATVKQINPDSVVFDNGGKDITIRQ